MVPSNVESRPTRAGFVAVLGAPNVGKSTLVNAMVGAKVTIVSSKAQTTRTRILGIRMADRTQIAFIDTPGIFVPRRRLDRAMVSAAWGAAGDADRILMIVDAGKGFDAATQAIVERLKAEGRTDLLLTLNKIDTVAKPKLLGLAEAAGRFGVFSEIFMVSARTGDGVEDLVAFLAENLPDGPWFFPEDQLSDLPERMLAAEVTREQLFHQLHQELPYSATVETDRWQERKDGSVRIEQTIFVERESQRAIVLGDRGQRIKAIGAAARAELEGMLDRRVHLFLFVKVREDWGDDPERYSPWGLDFKA